MIQLSTFIIIVSVVVSINAFTSDQIGFQKQVLRRTNKLREHHCVPPLKLDNKLSKTAQKYAEYLVVAEKFEYSNGDYGENVMEQNFTQPIKSYDGGVAVQFWYDEIKGYDYSDPGYSLATRCCTTLLWKNSKKLGVGMAFANNGRTPIVVAYYDPKGNIEGEYTENVLEPKC